MVDPIDRNASSSLLQSLSNLTDMKNVVAGNIAAQGQIKQTSTIAMDGNGSARVVTTSASNPQMLTQVLGLASKVGMESQIFNCQSQINNLLGDVNSLNSMGSQLNSFISALEKPIDSSSRAQVIHAAQNFSHSINNYATGLQNIHSDVQQKLQNSVESINSILRDLSSINQRANTGSDPAIETRREDLIRNLSSLISVQVYYTANGGINVRTQNGNQDLVVDGKYAQLEYQANHSALTTTPNTSAIVNFSYYNATSGESVYSTSIKVIDLRAYQGEFSGLLNVAQTVLPEALKNINNVANQIQLQMNAYHNKGAGFPPANGFTSSKTISETDILSFSGRANFGLVNSDGTAAKDNLGNYLKPMTLDASHLPSTEGPAGQFKVSDIIKEINNIASGYSKASVGLGAIDKPVGQPTQYLIDQVRMVAPQVNADGTINFQLELASGSQYNVDFRVEEVQVLDVGGANFGIPVANLPGVFTLQAGQRTKTGQQITAQLNVGDQTNLIRMKMVVANKDSGVFEEAFVDFKIDAGVGNTLQGAQISNSRIEAIPARSDVINGPVLPGGAHAANQTAAKMGGNGLVVASIDATGHLNISSGNTNMGLVIDSRDSQLKDPSSASYVLPQGFTHALGLNDLFIGEDAATFGLRPEIAANPNLLAQGKAALFKQDTTNFVPETQASACIFLNGANPNNGDTVTINGVVFAFLNALVGENAVQIGANTTDRLLAAIQGSKDIRLKDVVNAANDGAGGIKITAIVAGTPGNGITISATDANILKTDSGHGTNLPTNNLQGGTYAQDAGQNKTHLDKIDSFAYELHSNDEGIFQTLSSDIISFYNGTNIGTQTFTNFFGSFRTQLANAYTQSESDLKVDEKASEAIQVRYNNETRNTKDNRDEQMVDFIGALRSIEAILSILTQDFKAFESLIDMAKRV